MFKPSNEKPFCFQELVQRGCQHCFPESPCAVVVVNLIFFLQQLKI